MCMTAGEMISGIISGILDSWIVSSGMPWQSGLLAVPLLSIVPLIGLICTSSSFPSHKGSVQQLGVAQILMRAFRLFSIKSFLLMTLSLSFAAFQMTSLMFWSSSMLFNAFTSFPDAFFGQSYTT
ncbi:hypothetical protein PENTCL1PPCAC_21763 [Pristionchus entomophagus]|uniref:Uncharacterized protein n=1 Tax=Pristionchus entomophagus TaxID=358040 RepID=A0AAV5U091_9BILA|nr:hypothetical protein PENTCL1PPCAC_21763 [Pristionchus entomophagus]